MTIRMIAQPNEQEIDCPKCERTLGYTYFDTDKYITIDGRPRGFITCPFCDRTIMVEEIREV